MALADEGSLSVTRDVILVVPEAGHVRPAAEAPTLGDGLTVLVPVAIAAIALAALIVSRRQTRAPRGRHVRGEASTRMMAVVLAAALAFTQVPLAAFGADQPGEEPANAVRIVLGPADDGAYAGTGTLVVQNSAETARMLTSLKAVPYEGYSLSDGAISVTVEPSGASGKAVSGADMAKGVNPAVATNDAAAWTVPAASGGNPASLELSVSASESGLAPGEHKVCRIELSAPAPSASYKVVHYGANKAGTSYDVELGTETKSGVVGAKTEALFKEFTGYKPAGAIEQQAIAADGSTVVRVQYDRDAFIVTFLPNGHGNAIDDQLVALGSTATEPDNPAALGYSFKGWCADEELSEPYDFDAPVTSDLSLYAKWDRNSYSVAYDANGGTGTMDKREAIPYGMSFDLDKHEFTRDGFLFSGWNTSEDGSSAAYGDEQHVANLSSEDGATVTLYAQWQPRGDTPYKVIHKKETAGGSGVYEVAETDDLSGTTGAQTQAVAKEFEGFTAASITQKKISGDGTTEVEVLYNWDEYTVEFVTWGITDADVPSVNVYRGGTIEEPDTPTLKDGATFVGWCSDSALTTRFDFSTQITANTKVYLEFSPRIIADFGGKHDSLVKYAARNEAFVLADGFSEAYRPDFVPGYTFRGWYSDSSYETECEASVTPTADMTVFGMFAPTADGSTYTVVHKRATLDDPSAYGGAGLEEEETLQGTAEEMTAAVARDYPGFTAQPITQAVVKGDGSTVITVLYDRNADTPYKVRHMLQSVDGESYALAPDGEESLTGKTGALTRAQARSFEGFTCTSDFEQQTIGGDGQTVVEIRYDRSSYSVSFDANGQDVAAPDTQTVLHGGTAVDPGALVSDEYAFDGWYDRSTGLAYDFSSEVTADVHLYAKWREKQMFEVVFNEVLAAVVKASQGQQVVEGGYATDEGFTVKTTGYHVKTDADGEMVWYSDRALNTVFDLVNTAITKNADLYGGLEANTYTVAFHANGGTGDMSDQSRTYGDGVELTANAFAPATGYKFAGWTTRETGTTVEVEDKATEDLTDKDGYTVDLYAVWEPITYQIRYHENTGTGTMGLTYVDGEPNLTREIKYGESYALDPNKFANTNSAFLGWSTNASATAKQYSNKETVSDLAITDGAVVNLYALWRTGNLFFNANYPAGATPTSDGAVTTMGAQYIDVANDCARPNILSRTDSGTPGSEALIASAKASMKTVKVDKCVLTPPVSTTGVEYGFLGWNTRSDGTGRWVFDEEAVYDLVSSGGTCTLYAQWSHLAGVSANELKSNREKYKEYIGELWVSSDNMTMPGYSTYVDEYVENYNRYYKPTGSSTRTSIPHGDVYWAKAYMLAISYEANQRFICRLVDSEDGVLTFMAARSIPFACVMNNDNWVSEGKWSNSRLAISMNAPGGFVYDMLPSEIKSNALAVEKGGSSVKFWIPSQTELTGTSKATYSETGQRQYAYFKNRGISAYNVSNNAFKEIGFDAAGDMAGSVQHVVCTNSYAQTWMRSSTSDGGKYAFINNGTPSYESEPSWIYAVVPCFAL